MSITIDKSTAKALCFDDFLPDEMKIIEVSDWVDCGKNEQQTLIFARYDKFYSVEFSRNGSYNAGWYYAWSWDADYSIECYEVEKVKVTSYKWAIKE